MHARSTERSCSGTTYDVAVNRRAAIAQVVSRNLFKQTLAVREAVGIALIVIGVALLLNA